MKFKVIRQKVLVEAGPEKAYEAYVSPKKHVEFTGSPATGTPRVGDRFTAWDGHISGRFVALEKGKRIVHEWKTTEWPAGYPSSLVELTFKKRGEKTELTMVHPRALAEQANEYAQGWRDYYWEPLKEYFRKDE